MTTPEIHTFTVETTAGISEASGRLPALISTLTVQTTAEGGTDPEALREAASRLLTEANNAEAAR